MRVDIWSKNMSYKLEKPFTKKQRIDFIVKYNHNQSLNIEETFDALYALEKNEIIKDDKPIIDPDYENKQIAFEKQNEIKKLNEEINNLDLKRIRAICEPEIKNEETGETWLEYYNTQIQELRLQIQELIERKEENDNTEQDLSALDCGSEHPV